MKNFLKRIGSVLIAASMLVSTVPVLAYQSSAEIKIDDSAILKEEKITPLDLSDWTICIYMCGTDLESSYGAATYDLIEMLAADIPENVTVLVMTGAAQAWNPKDADKAAVEAGIIDEGAYITPDNEYTQIYRIDDDRMNLLYTYEENMDMGDICTVEGFMEFALSYAPSEHLMIELWNHGGGPLSGFEWDENTNNVITLAEFSQLAEAVYGARNKKTDIIGFDTCLTSNFETMKILSPFGDYMVASEEIEPGTGWNYLWLNIFDEAYDSQTTVDSVEIGKRIVDTFGKTYDENDEWSDSNDLTLALTDLSKIPALIDAFDKMSQELYSALDDPEKYAEIARRTEKVQGSYGGYYGLLDLYDFVVNMQGVLSSADEVLDVLGAPPGNDSENYVGYVIGDEPVVIYRGTGASLNNCIGMGFYYPTISTYIGADAEEANKMADIYSNIGLSDSYNGYIRELLLKTDKLQVFGGTMITAINGDTEHFYMELENPEDAIAIKSVDYMCRYEKTNEDGSTTVYSLGNEDVIADWDNIYFEETFDGTWYSINGEFFSCNMERYDGYTQYIIPVVTESTDYLSFLIAYELDYEPNVIYISSVYSLENTEVVTRSYAPDESLKFRTVLIEYSENDEGEYKYTCNDTVISPTLTESDRDTEYTLNIDKSELISSTDALYTMYFRIIDMKGNVYLSDPCMVILTEDINDFTIKAIPDQIYTGESVEPKIALIWNNEELYDLPEFIISYQNNIEKGTATVVVTSDFEDLTGELSAEFEIKDVGEIFADVTADDWFFNDVAYIYSKDYMDGVSETEFSPETPLTRGMFVSILCRLDNAMRFVGKRNFDDVDPDAYYAQAVSWAKSFGIVYGTSDTEFEPDSNITRAEIAVILKRYSDYIKLDTAAGGDVSQFNDSNEIDDWAQEAMSWAVGQGIIQGDEGNKLLPTSNATRAEAAVMIHRFSLMN